ncbi:MAG: Ig-like domain-containing protein [Propionibacteriaceae bacterium]|jgi:hypothetical protein|nr:Ig-like domain-containing protein [Propionibacteriaceae bacterium]
MNPGLTASLSYQGTARGAVLPIPFKPGEEINEPVICDPPTRRSTNLSVNPASVQLPGASTATALITDELCNPIPNVAVAFNLVQPGTTAGMTPAGGTAGTTVTVITGADGTASVTVADTVAETVTVHASTVKSGEIYQSPRNVTFTEKPLGPPSATYSTFAVDPVADPTDTVNKVNWQSGDGKGTYTATVTARDADQRLLPNINVSDFHFDATEDGDKVTVSAVTNNGDGTYSVTMTSKSGNLPTALASVTYGAANMAIGEALPIPFKVGAPSIDPDCEDPTKTGTNLSVTGDTTVRIPGPAQVKAHITDDACNAIEGETVTFNLDQPGTTASMSIGQGPTQPTTLQGVTDANGDVILSVTDTAPESVSVRAGIAAGTINGSPKTIAFVDESTPLPPRITSPSDDSITNLRPLPITGAGEAGSTVTVTDNGRVVCTTTVTAAGTWNCQANLNDGAHELAAKQEDPSGNVSPDSIPITVTVDTVAPGTPVIDKANGDEIAGTVPTPVQEGERVQVTYPSDTGTKTVTVTPDANGNWSIPTPDDARDGGTVTAAATDPAGNTSPSAPKTLDTTDPDAPTVDSANGDGMTGKAEPGASVEVSYPVTGGGSKTVPAEVDDQGNWSVSPLPEDAEDGPITVVATDPAGNPSPEGQGNLDATPPEAPVVDEANKEHVTGTVPGEIEEGTEVVVTFPGGAKSDPVEVGPGGTFVVPTPPNTPSGEVIVTVTDPAGNDASVTDALDTLAPDAPTIDNASGNEIVGSTQPGTTVDVTYQTPSGPVTKPATVDPEGNWTLTPMPTDVVDRSTVVAVATDPAGNPSDEGAATMDNTAPGAPSVDQANGNEISGDLAAPLEPDTTVEVTYPIAGGGTNTVPATVNPDGTWSVSTPDDAVDGPITVVATDKVGNESEPGTGMLDVTAPAPPAISQANDQGIAGKTEPNATVEVTYPVAGGGTNTVTTEAGPDGTWTIQPTPADAGDGTISVVATDRAGNESQPATDLLDVTAPTTPVIEDANDEVIGGKTEPGTSVVVTYPKNDGTPGTLIPEVDDNGNWSVPTPDDAVDGPITVVATDPKGNPSDQATGDLDVTPPGVITITTANETNVIGKVATPVDEGTTVDITWPNGDVTSDLPVASDGSFSVMTPADMPSGTITAVATDPAGNTSEATHPLDADADGAPTITKANEDVIEGKTTPGSTIEVTYPTAVGDKTVPAVVNPDGTWSVDTPSDATDGTVSAVATDPAGNDSPKGTAHLDVTDPAAPVIDEANKEHVTGMVPDTETNPRDPGSTVVVTWPDGTTSDPIKINPDDGSFTVPTPPGMPSGPIEVVVTEPSGNTSNKTEDLDTVPPSDPVVDKSNGDEITGHVPDADPGTTVVVTGPQPKDDVICTAEVQADGSWSCLVPDGTPSGDYEVIATDPSGNGSNPVDRTIDMDAPEAPGVDHANDKVIDGRSEPGATITVTYPKNDGSTGTTTTVVKPDGSWSVDTPADAKNGGTISVTATDPAGNVSGPTERVLDRTAPEAPVVNPSNGSEVSGGGEPGGNATVTDPGGNPIPGCENVAISADGKWSCTPTTPLKPGDSITVVVTDPEGNVSAPTTITVTALAIDVAYAQRHRLETQVVTGRNFNPGEQVCLVVFSTELNCGCQVAGADGSVTFTFTVPQDFELGAHTVTMTGAKSGVVSTTFQVIESVAVATGGAALVAGGDAGADLNLRALVAGLVVASIGVWVGTKRREVKRS